MCRESHGTLFRPCKCAGSIRYTHQECLLQWLQHSGKDSCELCKHKFDFRPVYAEDTPATIPARHVLARCLRKAMFEYLPFVARLLLAAGLWLGVVPCTTSWIYRIWIHRASVLVPDLIRRRLHGGGGAMLWNDAVSGIIIAIFIIFSFLSLMSFADFLRFHWDVRDGHEGAGVEEPLVAAAAPPPPPAQEAAAWDEEGNRIRGLPPAMPAAPLPPPPPPPPPQPAPEMDGGGGEGELELHIEIDELMGIRGPFPFLLRNILWLTAFNGAYLGLFAFIPYSVGAAVVGAAEKYVESPLGLCTLRFLVPPSICALAAEISQAAATDDHTLQLPDIGIILLGYLMMSAMVFTWRTIVCAVCQRVAVAARVPMLGKVVRVLECTAAVVKVGLLLFLKMLFLPLLLGLWLDAATAQVLGPDHAARVRWATENLVGTLLLHWVAGITFMLFVTVSVLQLREVLHPDLLARIIRPQEPQPDLLGSLLQESGLTHARRMTISLGIYVILLFLFIWIPAELLRLAATGVDGGATWPPLQLRTFYLAPQLQIPFELILFHLAMLAFLEHTKSAIGRLQHLWLRPFCAALGLTRFLLPLTLLPRGPDAPAVEAPPVEYVLGPPLRRPPVEWEEGGPDQGRWAWGNEPVSDIERNVAPRARPALCGLRLLVLLAASWVAILAMVLTALVLPLLLGRGIVALLRVPEKYHHDPFAFALGVSVFWAFQKWLVRLQHRLTPADVRQWAERASSLPVPGAGAAAVGVFALLWFGVAPVLLGLLFELVLVLPPQAWAGEGMGSLHLGADWALGLLLLHEWAYLAAMGVVDGAWFPRVVGPGAEDDRHNNQAAVGHTLQALEGVLVRWEWGGRATLAALVGPFVWPLTAQLLELVAVPAAAAYGLAHLRDKAPGMGSLAALPSPDAISTRELQLLCFRMTVLAWVLAMFSVKCMAPLHRWLASVQEAVKNERYLVQLRLVDYS